MDIMAFAATRTRWLGIDLSGLIMIAPRNARHGCDRAKMYL
jgi:hypothetical protein